MRFRRIRSMGLTAVLAALLVAELAAGLSAAGLAAPQANTGTASDQQIEATLRQEFAAKSALRAVTVAVRGGVATLAGSVPDYRAWLEANHRARQVRGVIGVVDQLRVNATSVPDAQLQRLLAQRLEYDRIGMGQIFNNLTLEVHDGMVVVGGQVASYADRDSALDIIADTPGVRGVQDRITVAPTSINDDRIRFLAARAIYGNPTLLKYRIDPAHPIRIVVANGRIRLEGVVNSQLDKTVAGNAARSVPGVFGVQNNLVVAKN
jgi:hyperosmotically inducible protein